MYLHAVSKCMPLPVQTAPNTFSFDLIALNKTMLTSPALKWSFSVNVVCEQPTSFVGLFILKPSTLLFYSTSGLVQSCASNLNQEVAPFLTSPISFFSFLSLPAGSITVAFRGKTSFLSLTCPYGHNYQNVIFLLSSPVLSLPSLLLLFLVVVLRALLIPGNCSLCHQSASSTSKWFCQILNRYRLKTLRSPLCHTGQLLTTHLTYTTLSY